MSLHLTLARCIRQLQHSRSLTFDEIGYQHNPAIREFQRVVMRGPMIEIDLITLDEAWGRGFSGVMVRGSGAAWDLRKAQPYECYSDLDFRIFLALPQPVS